MWICKYFAIEDESQLNEVKTTMSRATAQQRAQ